MAKTIICKETKGRTIKEYIQENEIRHLEITLEKCEELNAPAIITRGSEDALRRWKEMDIRISGEPELMNEKLVDWEVKKGRGGKVFLSINGGTILYFPYARFGAFIKRAGSDKK